MDRQEDPDYSHGADQRPVVLDFNELGDAPGAAVQEDGDINQYPEPPGNHDQSLDPFKKPTDFDGSGHEKKGKNRGTAQFWPDYSYDRDGGQDQDYSGEYSG